VVVLILLHVNLFAKESLYLHFPSELPSTNTQTSFGIELIRLINNAQHEIKFAIYGLRGQEEILKALMLAKKRGVEIKGVVDSDSHGENYYDDTHLLYQYFDIKSDHISYIMHNKFFIFDDNIVWTGSANLSDTGTGGYNANNVVVIDDKKIASIYEDEFDQMFHKKKFNNKKYEHSHKNIKTSDSTIGVFFSPKSNTYEEGIKELVKNAKKYIYIPIFYLTHEDLSYELIKAYKRGVDIKIILDATAARNNYSKHKLLREEGIEVKVENFGGKMHAKSMIIDDKYIVSGSMNFTKAGNSKNDENTLIIKNEKLAKQYKEYFMNLWRHIPRRYLHVDPNAESLESGKSCEDGIDNDFDGRKDMKDASCK
jgi:phosphatidylserine/phosphatidylglycerophosphate/cardiolipin synthase-like enzyme